MNAIVITDYIKNSGLGNYLRSKYLYAYLKKKNFEIDFQILSKKNKKIKKYNIIILDLPAYKYDIPKILKNYSKKNSRTIALDYIYKNKIDCNISIFKKNKYAYRNYVGLKYSIIREEFSKNKIKKDKDLFFISIGSSDIKNVKNKIKKIFSPYFKNIFLNINLKNKKKLDQKNYIQKMKLCEMAASNGGTTLLELLYLKKIVFVYPQNQLELNFSRYLKKKGYNIFINYFKIDKEKILKIKHKIQENRQIDKFGIRRISEIIFNYKNELHKYKKN